jgi:hypothetical protein
MLCVVEPQGSFQVSIKAMPLMRPARIRQGLSDTHRLRGISVQAMIEGSARARSGRTVNTRRTMASQKLDLKNGEDDDFFRQPSTIDA